MTQIFGAVLLWGWFGSVGRVLGGVAVGGPAVPAMPMKRASLRPRLENGPRTGAFFGPQFLLRGVFEPQTPGLFCG